MTLMTWSMAWLPGYGRSFIGRNEGLPGLQASFDYCPDSSRSSDGQLFFSMLSGLADVRLDHAPLNYQPPNVFIERVTADNQDVCRLSGFQHGLNRQWGRACRVGQFQRREGELRLPPGLQQVQFEFTALSFVSPENVQFRYMLEGLDKNWVDAGTLPHGQLQPSTAGSLSVQSHCLQQRWHLEQNR